MLKSIKMSFNYIERLPFCQVEQCVPVNQFQGRTLNTFTSCILVSQSPRKPQHNQALVGTMLYLHRDRARLASTVCTGPPWQLACPTHTLLVWQEKKPVLSQQRADITEGLARHGQDTLTLSRDKRASVNSKQGKIFPRKISPAQAVWDLQLLLRTSSQPKAYSYAAEQRQETAGKGLPFLTYFVLKPVTLDFESIYDEHRLWD